MSVSYLKGLAMGCTVVDDQVRCFRASNHCPGYYRHLRGGGVGDFENHQRCATALRFLKEGVPAPQGSNEIFGSEVVLKGAVLKGRVIWTNVSSEGLDGVDKEKVAKVVEKVAPTELEGAYTFAYCFIDGECFI